MTEREELIRDALALADKGVQINDGHVYQVPAHDLVLYSETIRALVAELQVAPAQALRDYAQARFLDYLLSPDLHWTEQPRGGMAQDYAKRAHELREYADKIDPTHG
ncbi:hypothetical protein SEA_MAGRITTE_191 [Microbacterium phage Magritte]|nr:hypothetical protein SEA_MAGRITTE_191 [Microbacterium phage Magritte]